MSYRLRALVLPFVGVVCSCLIVTAAPAPVERVTVKKADGTAVAGQLVSADHDAVIVQPAGKASPVAVPWKDVASVSNGLTRGQAVGQWKAKWKERLCGTCEGDRTTKHEACGGTGVDPATKQSCGTCKGAGTAGKCSHAKCKEGKVDCPGPCLKLSVGTWTMRDGKRVRTYKMPGGTGWVSDAHVGEVWVFKPNVQAENKGKCTVCGGTAKVDCGTCSGKGQLPCKACRGTGATGPACKDCQEGQNKCGDCKGSGLQAKG